jgi:hypothetical protein
MISVRDDNALLRLLKKLYSSIVMLYLRRLPKAYRRYDAEKKTPSLSSQLADCVEKIADTAVAAEHGVTDPPSVTTGNIHPPHLPVSSAAAGAGGLSLFLHDTHMHSAISLDAGDKLMHSTWEHIHASIRYARQGELKKARLHVQLANNAIKEAAHYVTEEVYVRFTREVEEVLKELAD